MLHFHEFILVFKGQNSFVLKTKFLLKENDLKKAIEALK